MARNARLDDVVEELAGALTRLHLATIELRRTVHATQHQRRTPNDIRSMMDLARRAVHRSRAIRRALKERFQVQ